MARVHGLKAGYHHAVAPRRLATRPGGVEEGSRWQVRVANAATGNSPSINRAPEAAHEK